MQAPGGPREDDDGGFTQGGWSVTYWEQMAAVMGEATSGPFAYEPAGKLTLGSFALEDQGE